MLWTSWRTSDGFDERHDIIAVGQLEPLTLDLAELERRIHANDKLEAKLDEVNLATIPSLMGQFAGRGDDLRPWLEGAEINRDASLRLEFLAGLSLWMTQADAIFKEIATYRRYPADVLRNDAVYKDDILQRLGLPKAVE